MRAMRAPISCFTNKKIVKSFNRIKQNKEWMAKKDGEESYDD